MKLAIHHRCKPNHPYAATRSYTLIELLCVLTIFAMAALAVATTAAGGLRVYQRGRHQSGLQSDLLIAMERFEKEARSAFVFDTIGFDGQRNSLAFPALVRRWDAYRQTFETTPGRVVYRFDSHDGRLLRFDQDYSQATAAGGARSGDERVLANGVDALEFRYFVYDEESESFAWLDNWRSDDALPVAIEVRLKASDPGGIVDFTRTLSMYAGAPPWQPAPERENGIGVVR